MKKLLFIFGIGFSLIAFSQVNVESSNNKQVISKKDSLNDLKNYKNASQFLGLIGTKIYAYPLNPNYDYSFISGSSAKFKTSSKVSNEFGKFKSGEFVPIPQKDISILVADKYFTITDVKFNNYVKELSPAEWDLKYANSLQSNVQLYGVDEKGTEYIFYDNFKGYLSMMFLDYLKRRYVGKNILYDKYKVFEIQDDLNRSLKPEYQKSNIVKVEEVVIQQANSQYASTPDIFLKTNIGNLPLTDYRSSKYTLQSEYDEFLQAYSDNEKRKKDEFLTKHEQQMDEYLGQKKIDDSIKLSKLLKVYPQKIAQRLVDGDVWIGMTREMLFESKGQPTRIGLSTETADMYSVQYIYESRLFGTELIYVDNGKVTAIQSY